MNVHKRVVVIDVSEERNQPRALVNPEIIARAGIEIGEEGCLSVPGIYDGVPRFDQVRVRAKDRLEIVKVAPVKPATPVKENSEENPS